MTGPVCSWSVTARTKLFSPYSFIRWTSSVSISNTIQARSAGSAFFSSPATSLYPFGRRADTSVFKEPSFVNSITVLMGASTCLNNIQGVYWQINTYSPVPEKALFYLKQTWYGNCWICGRQNGLNRLMEASQ